MLVLPLALKPFTAVVTLAKLLVSAELSVTVVLNEVRPT